MFDLQQLQNGSYLESLVNKLENSLSTKVKKSVEMALLYDTIGYILSLQGSFRLATKSLKKSHKIKERAFKKNSWHIVNSRESLGYAFFASDQLDDAKKQYIILQKIKKKTKCEDHGYIARINNMLGDICYRIVKPKVGKDKEGKYDRFRASGRYYHLAVKFAKRKNGDKFELCKAYYKIGKANLEKEKFKLAMDNFKQCLNIQDEISGPRRLLIADAKDGIAETTQLRKELIASKKKYKNSLIFRKKICAKENIDFVKSYFSEIWWEKYMDCFVKNSTLDRAPLTCFKKRKLLQELDVISCKLRNIYKILSDDSNSLNSNKNPSQNQKNSDEHNTEDFQWLKKKIDGLTDIKDEISNSNTIDDENRDVGILVDNTRYRSDTSEHTSRGSKRKSQKDTKIQRNKRLKFNNYKSHADASELYSDTSTPISRDSKKKRKNDTNIQRNERIKSSNNKATSKTVISIRKKQDINSNPNSEAADLSKHYPGFDFSDDESLNLSHDCILTQATTTRGDQSSNVHHTSTKYMLAVNKVKGKKSTNERPLTNTVIAVSTDMCVLIAYIVASGEENILDGKSIRSSSIDTDVVELAGQENDQVSFNRSSSIETISDLQIQEVPHSSENGAFSTECSFHFINTILIGSNGVGKSAIFELLTKQHHDRCMIPISTVIDIDEIISRNKSMSNMIRSLSFSNSNIPSTTRNLQKNIENVDNEQYQHRMLSSPNCHTFLQQSIKDRNSYSNGLNNACSDKFYAKIWNCNNPGHYQLYNFQSHIYISTFDVNAKAFENSLYKQDDSHHEDVAVLCEWIINTINLTGQRERFIVDINGVPEEFCSPLVILIPINYDSNLSEEESFSRFDSLMAALIAKVPSCSENFCTPKIIIDYELDKDGKSYKIRESQSCRDFQKLICNIAKAVPTVKLKGSTFIEWIDSGIATKLHMPNSIDDRDETLNAIKRRGKQMIALKEIQDSIDTEDGEISVLNIFEYLQDIGDVLLYQAGEKVDILVINILWLITIINEVYKIGDERSKLPMSGRKRKYYEHAKKTGVVPKNGIKAILNGYCLDDTDVEKIVQIMEYYGLIYRFLGKSETMQDNLNTQMDYFFPYSLTPCETKLNRNLSTFYHSSCLYLGFNPEKFSYITGKIFYNFLSSSQEGWKVKLYRQCAEYFPSHNNYIVRIKKSCTHICLQYSYQVVNNNDEVNELIKKRATDSIANDQPHINFKNELLKVVKSQTLSREDIQCHFYIECQECERLILIPKLIKNGMIKCSTCGLFFSANVIKDWKLYECIPEVALPNEANDFDDKSISCEGEDENQSDYESIPDSSLEKNSGENLESASSFCSTKRKRNQSPLLSEDSKVARGQSNSLNDPKSPPSLSSATRKALECCREEFERKNPYDEIKQILRRERVLTPAEIENINGKQNTADRSVALMEILLSRDDYDFLVVCDALENSSARSLDTLGKRMKRKFEEFKCLK
ncbi:hypothetical protein TrispH2_010656 [Trichoplax sp. H2]|nr:hypothetical protein TrispH2_010656 [Trichoplax sp. H2]|eukprot:RDD37562.1 hypothetical protein TrispH2_010656 [Trichoplax sp. H2]